MALIEIEYGSIASSETLNNNFDFFKGEIETVDAKIYSNSSTLESQIATLNANLLAKMEALDEIGIPIINLSNTLRDNEIWLEGAVVSRETYSKLYAIYGTTYGAGDGSLTFQLPDFRNRAIYGAASFGYLSAGLPNINGVIYNVAGGHDISPSASGAFSAASNGYTSFGFGGAGCGKATITLDASKSNSIYGKSTTVQPPAIKVRVKTRYQ